MYTYIYIYIYMYTHISNTVTNTEIKCNIIERIITNKYKQYNKMILEALAVGRVGKG